MLTCVWCFWENTPWCLGWLAEKLLFPALITVVVARFAIWQLGKKRQIDFADKQLSEFYGPMVAAQAEIANHQRFDHYMPAVARRDRAERLNPENKTSSGEDDITVVYDPFWKGIGRRLVGERINAYVKMRKLFADKMAFADPDTQVWYDYFYAFVEMWEVFRKDNEERFLPSTVRGDLGRLFDEQMLQPFNAHLRERCAHLQRAIAGDKSPKNTAPSPPSSEVEELLKRLDVSDEDMIV